MRSRTGSLIAILAVMLSAPVAADRLEELCRQYSNFDLDVDGCAEIERLAVLDSSSATADPLLLVVVESRLLASLPVPRRVERG
ncbi:hypothetical protein HS125_09160 [bacterium]|nr:hypothetical protein [bacterium]